MVDRTYGAALLKRLLSSIVLLFALLIQLTSGWATTVTAGITLTTDNESIYLGDTVVIEMEAVGMQDSVDITALFEEADLLRETIGTRIAVIEGKVVEVKLRRMEFLPRREGKIDFGPLQGESATGEAVSNVLNVEVLPASNEQWQPADDDLQISVMLWKSGEDEPYKSPGMSATTGTDTSTDTDVGKNTPVDYSAYIGERIILDITLRHQHQIADERISLPDFEGFDVLNEYELRRTVATEAVPSTVTSKNPNQTDKLIEDETRDWRIITWRYHLFAQRSGPLSIDAVSWSGLAVRSRTQRAEFTQRTNPVLLQIKPALPEMTWWFPSTEVSLSESWSKDARELTAGDEVFRTITLTARDVLASHLPEVKMPESRAILSTLVEQAREQQLIGNHIQASASFTFRLLAQSPIPVFLDTVRIPWYDTTESRIRETIVPARRINIGLPDRADLLADLALNERWTDRLTLGITTIANHFAYWHVSLAILSVFACFLVFREILAIVYQRARLHKDGDVTGLPRL